MKPAQADVIIIGAGIMGRAAAFFLRTKSATFPGMKIAEMFEVPEGPLLEEMRRNIVSAFLVIRNATPHMAKGGGSIVCISSDAAKIPWPFLTLYNTTKAGVEGLVRGSALELGPLAVFFLANARGEWLAAKFPPLAAPVFRDSEVSNRTFDPPGPTISTAPRGLSQISEAADAS